MKRSVQILMRIYTRMLSLYPRQYQAEYGEEQQTVFGLVVNEAAQRGTFSVIRLGLREMGDLPGAVLCEYLRERRKRKMEIPTSARRGDERGSRAEALAAIVPFLILGPMAAILSWGQELGYLPTTTSHGVDWFTTFTSFPPLLIGFGVGWAKGFPRWSYPYAMVVALILGGLLSNSLRLGYIKWGLYIVVLLVAAIFLLLVSVGRRLRPLYQSIGRDWTWLSFGLYILVLLAFALALDEVPTDYETPYMLGGSLIVMAGALLYMRSTTKSQRILALLICGTLAVTVAVIGSVFYSVSYYEEQLLPGLRRPGSWTGAARMVAIFWGWLAALMVAPALLGLFRPDKSLQAG